MGDIKLPPGRLGWPRPKVPTTDANREDELGAELDDLHRLCAALTERCEALQPDADRLHWWIGQARAALTDGRTPRVYRSAEAIDRARRAAG